MNKLINILNIKLIIMIKKKIFNKYKEKNLENQYNLSKKIKYKKWLG